MAAYFFLLAMVALPLAVAETSRLIINKCCDVNEQLIIIGESLKCVQASNDSFADVQSRVVPNVVFPPIDQQWLGRWLPPGLTLLNIAKIWPKTLIPDGKAMIVNRTSIFNGEQNLNDTYWRHNVVFDDQKVVIRNQLSNKLSRTFKYCVDSLKDSKIFLLQVKSSCPFSPFDTIKCCKDGLLQIRDGKISCKREKQPTRFHDLFNVVLGNLSCPEPFRTVWSAATAEQIQDADFCLGQIVVTSGENRLAHCADSVVGDEEARLAMVWCEQSSVLGEGCRSCRYLPFATVALLAAALAVIAGSAPLRRSAHGWALASHAACLLLFNAGQAAFALEGLGYDDFSVPLDKKGFCLAFAFVMYILIVAANNWLAAVSLNMATGFSVAPRRRAGAGRGRERRRFLRLCACAWGLTAALATAAIATFYHKATPQYYRIYNHRTAKKYDAINYVGPWYLPAFAETRTCFSDIRHFQSENSFGTNKLGSLLFYFGPASALLLVNVGCLASTARRVHRLRRGNSLLQRAEEEGGRRRGSTSISQAQSIVVYVKLLLSAGAIETVAEILVWATSQSSGLITSTYVYKEHSIAYRSVGSVCDLVRALCVLWLAAPSAHEKMAALCRLTRITDNKLDIK